MDLLQLRRRLCVPRDRVCESSGWLDRWGAEKGLRAESGRGWSDSAFNGRRKKLDHSVPNGWAHYPWNLFRGCRERMGCGHERLDPTY